MLLRSRCWGTGLGTLVYGPTETEVEFDDRALAHLQLVIGAKLRRNLSPTPRIASFQSRRLGQVETKFPKERFLCTRLLSSAETPAPTDDKTIRRDSSPLPLIMFPWSARNDVVP